MRKLVRALQSSAKSALRPARLVAPMAALGLMTAMGVQAASPDAKTFNVNINLTAACTVTPASDINVNYLSFGPAVTGTGAAQTTVGIKCTNGLRYRVALDTGPGAGSGGVRVLNSYTYRDSAVDLGYTLALTGTGLNVLTGAGVGNGLVKTVAVRALLLGGQGGVCATPGGACSNAGNAARLRTMTVSW
jgi:spore coat protein U-like protein